MAGNSARSIMAESLLNAMGQGRLRAYSAGSHPAGQVHALAIQQLQAMGLPTDGLRSKSWDEFAGADAPQMDCVITVCDNAAGEMCPFWPGQPIGAHWGFADPAAATGTEEEKRQAFERVFQQIQSRVRLLVDLPLKTLEPSALKQALAAIGQTGVVV